MDEEVVGTIAYALDPNGAGVQRVRLTQRFEAAKNLEPSVGPGTTVATHDLESDPAGHATTPAVRSAVVLAVREQLPHDGHEASSERPSRLVSQLVQNITAAHLTEGV